MWDLFVSTKLVGKSRSHAYTLYTHLSRPRVYLTRSPEVDCRILLSNFVILYPPLPVHPVKFASFRSERNAKLHFAPDALSGWPKIAAHFAYPARRALDVKSDVTDGQLKCYNLLPPVKCLALTECVPIYSNERASFLFTHNLTVLSATWVRSMLKKNPIKFLRFLLINLILYLISESHFSKIKNYQILVGCLKNKFLKHSYLWYIFFNNKSSCLESVYI